MNLNSESFDRAASNLVHALNNFQGIDTFQLGLLISQFDTSISRLARIAGMQAENEQRSHVGASPAYVERDFLNV